jgi:hypothetical protein
MRASRADPRDIDIAVLDQGNRLADEVGHDADADEIGCDHREDRAVGAQGRQQHDADGEGGGRAHGARPEHLSDALVHSQDGTQDVHAARENR